MFPYVQTLSLPPTHFGAIMSGSRSCVAVSSLDLHPSCQDRIYGSHPRARLLSRAREIEEEYAAPQCTVWQGSILLLLGQHPPPPAALWQSSSREKGVRLGCGNALGKATQVEGLLRFFSLSRSWISFDNLLLTPPLIPCNKQGAKLHKSALFWN